jgi:predicted dehydrogenase
MVNVGIIGPGLLWESKYEPALNDIRKRIRVRAVYDAVMNRAEQVAAELEADVSPGILALIERPDIQAVLFLDPAWYGHQPIRFAIDQHKPVYVAGCLGGDTHALQQLYQEAAARGLTVMPEFDHRYTPATNRLHELMATRLGKPKRIIIEASAPADDAARSFSPQDAASGWLASLFDWCRYVVRKQPVALQAQPWQPDTTGQADGGYCITLEFAAGKPEQPTPIAELRFPNRQCDGTKNADSKAATAPAVRRQVVCEQGEAVVEGAADIFWCNGTDSQTECLTGDRSAVDVMLDHFCRRVVGGLIPVADLNDLCHGLTLTHSVETSLQTGQTVRLQ